jgi:hypothetical protein
VQAFNSRIRRSSFHPCALTILFALVGLAETGAQVPAPPRNSSHLSPPVETLARSFRTGHPGVLRTLLQESGKIRVYSPALGMKSGYYSGDQVYFLFQDVFRIRRTLNFHILKGEEIPPHSERQTVVARWTYREGNSRELTADLSFELMRREEVWCIQEIRELL